MGSTPYRPSVQPPSLLLKMRYLSALTPVGRQAFLLVAMEEFNLDDAALVLDMSAADVGALIEEANQDLSAQIATDVVIMEDEPLIAVDLQALVQELGHRVVRIARTEMEAIKAVMQARPGLVLADFVWLTAAQVLTPSMKSFAIFRCR
jgi:hypothetical protein